MPSSSTTPRQSHRQRHHNLAALPPVLWCGWAWKRPAGLAGALSSLPLHSLAPVRARLRWFELTQATPQRLEEEEEGRDKGTGSGPAAASSSPGRLAYFKYAALPPAASPSSSSSSSSSPPVRRPDLLGAVDLCCVASFRIASAATGRTVASVIPPPSTPSQLCMQCVTLRIRRCTSHGPGHGHPNSSSSSSRDAASSRDGGDLVLAPCSGSDAEGLAAALRVCGIREDGDDGPKRESATKDVVVAVDGDGDGDGGDRLVVHLPRGAGTVVVRQQQQRVSSADSVVDSGSVLDAVVASLCAAGGGAAATTTSTSTSAASPSVHLRLATHPLAGPVARTLASLGAGRCALLSLLGAHGSGGGTGTSSSSSSSPSIPPRWDAVRALPADAPLLKLKADERCLDDLLLSSPLFSMTRGAPTQRGGAASSASRNLGASALPLPSPAPHADDEELLHGVVPATTSSTVSSRPTTPMAPATTPAFAAARSLAGSVVVDDDIDLVDGSAAPPATARDTEGGGDRAAPVVATSDSPLESSPFLLPNPSPQWAARGRSRSGDKGGFPGAASLSAALPRAAPPAPPTGAFPPPAPSAAGSFHLDPRSPRLLLRSSTSFRYFADGDGEGEEAMAPLGGGKGDCGSGGSSSSPLRRSGSAPLSADELFLLPSAALPSKAHEWRRGAKEEDKGEWAATGPSPPPPLARQPPSSSSSSRLALRTLTPCTSLACPWRTGAASHAHLLLLPSDWVPLASVRVSAWRGSNDCYGKAVTTYTLSVRAGGLRWEATRRFRDFRRLAREVERRVAGAISAESGGASNESALLVGSRRPAWVGPLPPFPRGKAAPGALKLRAALAAIPSPVAAFGRLTRRFGGGGTGAGAGVSAARPTGSVYPTPLPPPSPATAVSSAAAAAGAAGAARAAAAPGEEEEEDKSATVVTDLTAAGSTPSSPPRGRRRNGLVLVLPPPLPTQPPHQQPQQRQDASTQSARSVPSSRFVGGGSGAGKSRSAWTTDSAATGRTWTGAGDPDADSIVSEEGSVFGGGSSSDEEEEEYDEEDVDDTAAGEGRRLLLPASAASAGAGGAAPAPRPPPLLPQERRLRKLDRFISQVGASPFPWSSACPEFLEFTGLAGAAAPVEDEARAAATPTKNKQNRARPMTPSSSSTPSRGAKGSASVARVVPAQSGLEGDADEEEGYSRDGDRTALLGGAGADNDVTVDGDAEPPGPSSPSPVPVPLSVMPLSRVTDLLLPGDILLFSCRNAPSTLQRAATSCRYDHAGVVVDAAWAARLSGSSGTAAQTSPPLPPSLASPPGRHRYSLVVLEASGEGVRTYPLLSRLRAYGTGYTHAIAVRRLLLPGEEEGEEQGGSPGPSACGDRCVRVRRRGTCDDGVMGRGAGAGSAPSSSSSAAAAACPSCARARAVRLLLEARLGAFADSVEGKASYALGLRKLLVPPAHLQAAKLGPAEEEVAAAAAGEELGGAFSGGDFEAAGPGGSGGLGPPSRAAATPLAHYFCTELIACAYMAGGLLPGPQLTDAAGDEDKDKDGGGPASPLLPLLPASLLDARSFWPNAFVPPHPYDLAAADGPRGGAGPGCPLPPVPDAAVDRLLRLWVPWARGAGGGRGEGGGGCCARLDTEALVDCRHRPLQWARDGGGGE
jgi:hypothetical protein